MKTLFSHYVLDYGKFVRRMGARGERVRKSKIFSSLETLVSPCKRVGYSMFYTVEDLKWDNVPF
jgi:hypothetical protein